MESFMPGLFAVLHDPVRLLCATPVGPGRGAAIALTVALIVAAFGQLRPGGTRERRPLL